jgi:hypothetical protein
MIEDKNEVLSLNKVVEILDQPRTDCPSLNHAELRHYIFHHFSFHLHTASSAIVLLANFCCVVQVFWLIVNSSIVLYTAIRDMQKVFCVAGLLDVERTTTLHGKRLCHPLYSAQFGDKSAVCICLAVTAVLRMAVRLCSCYENTNDTRRDPFSQPIRII